MMTRHFRLFPVIPGFFLSSLILMLLWDAIAPRLGLPDIGYVTSMLLTIVVLLAAAPMTAVVLRRFR